MSGFMEKSADATLFLAGEKRGRPYRIISIIIEGEDKIPVSLTTDGWLKHISNIRFNSPMSLSEWQKNV